MGESKRTRLAPCRCGSGKAAATCCLSVNGWHKKPEIVNLRPNGESRKHESCYLNSTNACSSKISGEHLISHGVLKVLAEKQVELSGLPWLKGQKKTLGFAAMTANCLCTVHNSALSPIDVQGARFFDAIQRCAGSQSGPANDILLSGHDIERWLLRTLAALAVSKNFAIDGAVLDDKVAERLRLPELLEDPTSWRRPLGLYMMEGANYTILQRETLQFAPLTDRDTREVIGILINIQGLQLSLLALDHAIEGTGLDKAVYRPGTFTFRIGHLTHSIKLSWDDEFPHMNFTLTWKP